MSSSNHLLVDKPKYVIQAMDTHLLVPSPLAEEEDGLGYQNTLEYFLIHSSLLCNIVAGIMAFNKNSLPKELDWKWDGDLNKDHERIIHDEDFGEENVELVDSEWADFERALREFRERRISNVSMEKLYHRPKKTRRVRPQAFYPCPPPTAAEMDKDDSSDEDDPFGYIDTLNNVLRRFQENSQTPLELAQKLSNDGYLFYCVPQTLATTLDEMNVDELKPYPKGNAKGFVKYLDEWMGFA